MEDIMKAKKDPKTEFIRFRVTPKEKDKLIHAAESGNESLSSYILKRSLQEYPGIFDSFPQIIDTNNLFNEIYHRVEKSGNKTLAKEIISLFRQYLPNSGRKE